MLRAVGISWGQPKVYSSGLTEATRSIHVFAGSSLSWSGTTVGDSFGSRLGRDRLDCSLVLLLLFVNNLDGPHLLSGLRRKEVYYSGHQIFLVNRDVSAVLELAPD